MAHKGMAELNKLIDALVPERVCEDNFPTVVKKYLSPWYFTHKKEHVLCEPEPNLIGSIRILVNGSMRRPVNESG